MNIEDHVRWAIYNYPLLYRTPNNPELSRLKVLNHLFFVIGNGFEWDRDKGVLVDGKVKELKELPEGFFEKELYDLDVLRENANGFKQVLEDRFYYIIERGYRGDERIVRFVFEATEAEAVYGYVSASSNFHPYGIGKYSAIVELTKGQTNSPHTENYSFDDFPAQQDYFSAAAAAASTHDFHPYRIGKYSAIVELTKGQTNSPHIENYSFDDFPPQRDWLDACADVARECLAFYNDEARYINDSYHPRQSSGLFAQQYEKAEKEGKLAEYRKEHYKDGETVEERAERSFRKHRQSQIDKAKAFLSKYYLQRT